MYDQLTQQFINFSRSQADAALKAQQIASEAFTKCFSMQMELAEDRAKANGEFATQAAEVRDPEAAKEIMPQGSELFRDNAEKAMDFSREMLELSMKTGEQFSELFQTSFDSAKAEAEKVQAKATTTTKTKKPSAK